MKLITALFQGRCGLYLLADNSYALMGYVDDSCNFVSIKEYKNRPTTAQLENDYLTLA